jgi:hypothetical protein
MRRRDGVPVIERGTSVLLGDNPESKPEYSLVVASGGLAPTRSPATRPVLPG